MRALLFTALFAFGGHPGLTEDAGTVRVGFTRLGSELGFGDFAITRTVWSDLNGDLWPDLIVHSAEGSPRGNAWVLWNDRRGSFERPQSEPFRNRDPAVKEGRLISFVSTADVDNDGDQDLFTGTHYNWDQPKGPDGTWEDRCELLLNDGKGGFAFVEAERNPWLQEKAKTTSAVTWLDYNLDGSLDLFLANWYCQYGKSLEAYQAELYRGDGRGGFVRATEAAGLATIGTPGKDYLAARPAYGCGAWDYDGDGHIDIFVPAYGRQWNLVWRSRGDGTFEQVADRIGLDGDEIRHGRYPQPGREAEAPFRSNGNTFEMDPADFDADGDMDVFLAEIAHGWAGDSSDLSCICENLGAERNFVFRRRLDLLDRAPPGPGGHWADLFAAWIDADNDGRMDLLTAGAHYPGVGLKLWRQNSAGRFVDAAKEFGVEMPAAHGLAVADHDLDGDVDFTIVQLKQPGKIPETKDLPHHTLLLFRNDLANGSHWIALDLEGDPAQGTNRDAVGALVWIKSGGVERQFQVTGGTGQGSPHGPRTVCAGLGSAEKVDSIRIVWPNPAHTRQQINDLAVDRRYRIRQGQPPVPSHVQRSSQ